MDITFNRPPEKVLNWQAEPEGSLWYKTMRHMDELVAMLQSSTVQFASPLEGSFRHTTLNLRYEGARTHVHISTHGSIYTVEYYLAPEKAPWVDAIVQGITPAPEQAIEMILIALEEVRQ